MNLTNMVGPEKTIVLSMQNTPIHTMVSLFYMSCKFYEISCGILRIAT